MERLKQGRKETYLFRAACSELSAEVKNNRKAADEQMRQQRTMLQHEVDILTQTLNQELANLDDGVKNMFNERKMAVKEEQSEIGSAVSAYYFCLLSHSTTHGQMDGKSHVQPLHTFQNGSPHCFTDGRLLLLTHECRSNNSI